MSEKNFMFSILNDYYGNLLKDNQETIIDLYYNQDYSLSEISEEMNISRQGIHDALKRAEKSLLEYEDKMKLHIKFEKFCKAAENIVKLADSITDDRYRKTADNIKTEAGKITEDM